MIRLGTIAALCTSIACGDPAAQVQLVRVGGSCGAVTDTRTLIIRALSDNGEVSRAVSAGGVATLTDLPVITRQVTVEVLGAGGAVRTVGKSAPLELGALRTGDIVPVAMVPLNSACPTDALLEPRVAPVVARAGRYVLVLGGDGAAGPLATAELYDPTTDRFEAVPVPARLAAPGSFTGAAATTLVDGRVVITGGPTGSYTVFDPRTKRFGPPIVLEPRFFHSAVALGGDRLLVAGGCRGLTAGACNGDAARTTFRLAVDTDQQEFSSTLERDHVQPTLLLDPGLAAGLGVGAAAGRGAGALIIGSATAQQLPVEVADRVDLGTDAAAAVSGTYAAAVALDSGAVLSGFAVAGLAANSGTSVLTPQLLVRPGAARAGAPALRAASLTALEDGTALAVGEPAGGGAAAWIYHPTQDQWRPVALPPEFGEARGHRAVRLDDGSVLLVGLGGPGAPAATAWRFRPSLSGPFAAATIAVPSDEKTAELVLADPQQASVDSETHRFEMLSNRSGLGQWAVLGGPRLVRGKLTAVVRFQSGGLEEPNGVALLSHFESPAALVVTQLVPGQAVTVRRLAGAEVTEPCRGQATPSLGDGPVPLTLSLSEGELAVKVGEVPVLACTVPELPRGSWGLGVIGAGTRVGIDTLTVER